MESESIRDLFDYIKASTSPVLAVEEAKKSLLNAGFVEVSLDEKWTKSISKFFTIINSSMLVAFNVGVCKKHAQLRVAAAHTDQPCFHIKPVAELSSDYVKKLNVEVYGGPILTTFFDEPLSISGRVALKGKDAFSSRFVNVDFKRPVGLIPNLAIHLNRNVNEGVAINKQVDLMPIFGTCNPEKDSEKCDAKFFTDILAKEIGVSKEEIVDFDLYVYVAAEPVLAGFDNELVISPRLDNLVSCYSILEGIKCEAPEETILAGVLYDHEEIGSRSSRGADSMVLSMLIDKLYSTLGLKDDVKTNDIFNGYFLSVDAAHALHPNHPEKYDPTSQAKLNKGFVLKTSSTQRYAYDLNIIATIRNIADEAHIPYQLFANRSDIVGGSTLGPIASSFLPMHCADIGIPMWAMHSSKESAGVSDIIALNEFLKRFYEFK